MKTYFTVSFLLLTYLTFAQSFQLKNIETKVNSSIRGLSVINDRVAWVSGSNGWVGVSDDGGNHWDFRQVTGYEKMDFRSLYAFDQNRAIIANAGSPGNVLITTDAGKTWKTVYSNFNEAAFFDGMDFWNEKEGLIYGDPIDGKMLLLKTEDGGNTWKEVANAPNLNEGEASFAASGTGIRCIGKSKAIISTGGIVSRLWVSSDKGETWSAINTPIIQGEATTGIYSFAVDKNNLILVGGDYSRPELATKHNLYSTDYGSTWNTPIKPSRGYRECVEFVAEKVLFTTGPTGTDISYDKGINWKPFSEEKGFHVLRKARKGSLIIIAGSNGQISIIQKKK